jgi:peroxiredoxin Q/BCP
MSNTEPTTDAETSTRAAEGQPAPEFALPSQIGDAPIHLSDYRGKTVVLYFYAKDDTPG